MNRHYYKNTYTNHWAFYPYKLSQPNVIALVTYKDNLVYAVYLNPTDQRGYRCIVRYIGDNDLIEVEDVAVNRDYTRDERRGLAIITELMEQVYSEHVPIVQTFKAGNNSHSFDPVTRTVTIGTAKEPNFLHTHIVGRGDPEYEYIEGVKLCGPVAGLNFDMMGKTVDEAGNESKVTWNEADMIKVCQVLRQSVDKHVYEYRYADNIMIYNGK